MNKEFLKKIWGRASTWITAIATLLTSILVFIPQLGYSDDKTAWIMLGVTAFINIAQHIPQGKK